jgi:protein-tyrosine sulfotransferase
MSTNLTASSNHPIFILSTVRSGSTLLRYIMDTHPEICSPGELDLGQLCSSLKRVVDSLMLGRIPSQLDPKEREQIINAEVRRVVSGLMDDYAKSKAKSMWCEKSPRNTYFIEVLNEVFPDGKYICLYRNCMDVVNSCIQATRAGRFKEELIFYARNTSEVNTFIDSWVERNSMVLKFERENPSKCFRLKYETLVTDPQSVLAPMFSFIGVRWDPKIVSSVFAVEHDDGPGDVKVKFSKSIHQSSVGKGSTIARSSIDNNLLKKMNDLLKELDYPVVGPDWDRQPSPYVGASQVTGGNETVVSATKDVFANYFPAQLQKYSDKLPEIKGVYKFVITGTDGGIWIIDLTKTGGQIIPGDSSADSTIVISSVDLIDVVNGKLNPAEAFSLGKFRVSGNIDQVIKMGEVLLR